jgi:thioredoxin-like negative regulator of GroEL
MAFRPRPIGTFAWLGQVFCLGVQAGLRSESQSVLELIMTVSPSYPGRPLLEGMLLFNSGRFQEASEQLSEMVKRDPEYYSARVLLFECLHAMNNPDWVEHARALAALDNEEVSALARRRLVESGHEADVDDTHEHAPATSAHQHAHGFLVRV